MLKHRDIKENVRITYLNPREFFNEYPELF